MTCSGKRTCKQMSSCEEAKFYLTQCGVGSLDGNAVDDALLQYLSPLGWEHINLTGDYLWRSSAKIGAGKFRPLRPLQPGLAYDFFRF